MSTVRIKDDLRQLSEYAFRLGKVVVQYLQWLVEFGVVT